MVSWEVNHAASSAYMKDVRVAQTPVKPSDSYTSQGFEVEGQFFLDVVHSD